jgi:hypothetical protein
LERARSRALGPREVCGIGAGRGALAVSVTSGKPVPVRAAIDLAGLTPDDVRVEVVMGRVDSNGYLEETEVMVLPPMEQTGQVAVFGKDMFPIEPAAWVMRCA